MNEEAIASQLAQKVTSPPDTVLTPVVVPVDTSYGQATIAPVVELDEMTQYKMHDLFGETYHDSDEIKRQQVQYIYGEVAKLVESSEYGFVAAKVRDLERIIGLNGAPDRLYRLYQWLKLDNTRKSVEAEMSSLNG